jgi:ketosteroid isomerase-like protein
MRIALAFLVMGAAWLTASGATDSSVDAAMRSELLRLEASWNDAHVRGDADVLNRLWDGELTVTVPGMPVMRKAQALAITRSGRVKFERYETSDLNVIVLGDAAFVTGRVFRTRHVNGRAAEDDWNFTKVYFRRSDGWKVVAWHSSPAAIE